MLTLEEFKEESNNFYLHFIKVEDNVHRKKPALNKLQEENYELEERLTSLFSTEFFTEPNFAIFSNGKSIKKFIEQRTKKKRSS